MQYRNITNDKISTSVLGFGLMRLPIENNDNCTIDKIKSFEMMKYLYDNGVNYFDTAYTYHCENSETLLGEFIETIDRSSIYVATKLPMWLCNNYEDYETHFNTQLKRLKSDYIDFYLTHSLTEKSFKKMVELDAFKFLDELKSKSKIKYAGFSFHDELPIFKEILNSYNWDFCQIQLNYLDKNYQAGLEGLKLAREKGISVIVMEPLKGGNLANLPKDTNQILEKYNIKSTPVQLALKWVYDQDISLLLSGMSNMDQCMENVALADTVSEVNTTIEDRKAIDELVEFLNNRISVGCTSCEYCMPCPFDVNIPGIFQRFNNATIFDNYEANIRSYQTLIENNNDAGMCTECGACESLCPQNIEIISKLKEADSILKNDI